MSRGVDVDQRASSPSLLESYPHYSNQETRGSPARKDEYERLLMNQTQFVGITASMIGKAEKAASMMHLWMMRFLLDRILLRSRPEDKSTLAFAYVENGLCKLRQGDPTPRRAAETDFRGRILQARFLQQKRACQRAALDGLHYVRTWPCE